MTIIKKYFFLLLQQRGFSLIKINCVHKLLQSKNIIPGINAYALTQFASAFIGYNNNTTSSVYHHMRVVEIVGITTFSSGGIVLLLDLSSLVEVFSVSEVG